MAFRQIDSGPPPAPDTEKRIPYFGLAIGVPILIFLVFAASAHAQTRPGIVVPIEGERFTARLAGIDGQGNFTFETQGKTRNLAAKDLVSFGAWSDGERGPVVVFADGGTLVAGSLDRLSGQQLVVTADPWGQLRLPLGSVRGIVFRPPADALARDKLYERVTGAKGDEDQLLLDNGDVVSGLIKAPPEVQGPPDPDKEPPVLRSIQLETKAGPAVVTVEKLLAVMFNPALVETPRQRGMPTWLGFKVGSRLAVSQIVTSGGKVKCTLLAGQALTAGRDEFLEDLVSVQPLASGVTYLSDLTPTGYKHIPFLELAWNYGTDKNVLGGRLRSGGAVYAKGLALHSTARLAYRLDGRYRRFAADLALDDSAGPRGSVIYRVFVERGANEWKPAYESPVVRSGDAPLAISVDISGAQRLALIVDFADHGDELDHANWLNARLVK